MTARKRADAPPGFDRRLLAPMMLGSVLNPVNSSIIAVALVPIGAAFGAPSRQTAWLVSALYLATAIGQPLLGRLIDLFGPRRLFLLGAALTGVGGVLGMLAPELWVLVAARVVLGLGTCAGYPAAMYLIRNEAERTGLSSPAGVLTALSVTTQTVAVVGPTLGGVLIALGGWRATFAINIPLAVACVVLGWFVLPRTTVLDEERRGTEPFDTPGVVLFSGTLLALLVLLMTLRVDTLWLLALTLVMGAGFAWRELRARAPFVDVRVFAGNVPLLITYARALLAATVSYSFVYGFSQWLEDGRGLSATDAGLVLLPTFATGIVVATVTGRRPVIRAKLMVGAATQAVGCALLLVLQAGTPIIVLVLVAVVLGVPQGLVNLAVQNALYHQADPSRIGASAGLLRTFLYVGAIVSAAASGALFGARATTAGLHQLAILVVVLAVAFLVITVVDPSLRVVDRTAAAALTDTSPRGARRVS